ncbi:MAG TPA: TetR family transcriptional regulator [Actinomycetota bacterium]|nr:TetR family transcriptional regulator [Actinomycetota bacterium]
MQETLTPRAAEVVAAARRLLEAEGPAVPTMRRVAGELGIRAPSLYKHLRGKQAIEVALIEAGLEEMGGALHDELRAAPPSEAIPRLLARYRALSRAQPNLNRLATAGQLPRDLLRPGLEDWAAEPFVMVTGEENLARALWAFAHGLMILEIDGRSRPGADLDGTWAAGAAAFRAAVAARRGLT